MKFKLKRFLIILNVMLFIILVIQLADNTLYLKDIKTEFINAFSEDYVVNIHKMREGKFVILATIPEELYREMDYTEKVNQFKDSLSKYKINPDKVNRIVLNVGYHGKDTKYIQSTTDIDLRYINQKSFD
ncbi:hypothetical protein [Tissierella pigra]|uniref:Uncharacterized protein n=1 Tax=Tissierella pigra TaxID=2607614 RepID=A0A6N7XIC8_9FIRM|nr:hypothetical protein [Tissierella pigra]MSU01396.1 hypothetical protein [Tissierella pigra]